MKKYTLWHNPRCGKSREALELLHSKKIEPVIRLYLKDTPSVQEIKQLLVKLKMRPADMTRSKEPQFRELIDPDQTSDESWIAILSENPILIERPILMTDEAAVIGRPPEIVLTLV